MRARALVVLPLTVLLLVAVACDVGGTAPPRHLLLVSIDTCRADHLSAYGYPHETSPALEALARRGVRFDRAFSQAPDTTPSHATMLTSQYPFHHGAANGVPLGPAFVTLAEVLGAQGYRTGAFVGGWTMTARASGLAQGFDVYDDELTQAGTAVSTNPNERPAAETTDRALAWLSEHAEGSFFLFVHYFDPHAVYMPPAPYDTMFDPQDTPGEVDPRDIPAYARIGAGRDMGRYVALYDGEIRYVDDQIARIVTRLEELGLRDDTLIVVTADHGEGLGEHGTYFSHGFDLFDESLRVPLIVSYPGHVPEGRIVDGIAQTTDIMPTVLDLLQVEGGFGLAGRSLLPAMVEGARTGNRYTLARTTKTLTYPKLSIKRNHHDLVSYRTEDRKFIQSGDGSMQVFDLIADPQERHDVSDERPDERDRLHELLGAAFEEIGISEAGDDEALEQLRSLGYVR